MSATHDKLAEGGVATDRELMELAAKAAGIEVWGASPLGENYGLRIAGLEPTNWNPLADDGDALRLAVHLEFDLMLYGDCKSAHHGLGARMAGEPSLPDPYAATRRAIVRAAAAIASASPTAHEAQKD